MGGQYFVYLAFIDMKNTSSRKYYLDTFAENGDFLGRKPVPSHWRYLPIHGSGRIVKLNSETMELFAFTGE